MSADTNGRVKLSVREIIMWATLLAAILGGWYDGRSQQALTQQKLAIHIEDEHEARGELKAADSHLWQAVRDAQASEKVKPRR
jgi:hypothetical protein